MSLTHPAHSVYTADTLRVALIGYGLAGSVFHAPLIAATPGMSIAAIVTSSPIRQQQARQDFPSAEILTEVDALWSQASRYDLVVVAAPNRSHASLGIAALNAGLPVVIDKPLAASAADAEQLIATSKKTGKLLTVFQNRRWDNDFLTVRQLIAADLLGPITRFESRYERYRAQPRANAWRESATAEDAGGLLYDLGSHLIDQAAQLFGRPSQVYAEMERQRPGALVDDDTFVALTFAHGIHAHLWMSVVARIAGPRVRLSGLRGTYEKWGLDPQEDALRTGMRPGDPTWGKEPREQWGKLSTDVGGLHIEGAVETLPGSYESYYALLREALITGGPPPVNPADAALTLRIIEAAQQSADSGKLIEFA
jgi:scyllo-inositol 2-dehydrogenase (NADP+)